MRLAGVLGAVLMLLAAACQSDNGQARPQATETAALPTPMAYNIPADMSSDQLGSIALALADFGPEFTTFAPTTDSQLTSVLERGLNACDPAKEQTALNKYGWSKGYMRFFGPTDGGLPNAAYVGSAVDVYSSPENASTKIKYDSKQVREDQRAPNGCNGVGIERVSDLALPIVGDQSWAVRLDFSVDHVRGTRHQMTFRRDRIVVTVAIERLNAQDAQQQLLDLAKKVDERLLKVITAPLTFAEPIARTVPLL